ncbi:transposase [Synechococcus sp. WC101]|uniref:transposase n=1 Tax=Synechococcus sp. WC101 TaxID=2964536 RepID=UPI0039C47095
MYGFKRAVEVFAQGLGEALTYLDFPGVHQRHIKSTNVLERLIREVKRRSFPGEGSLVNLATVVMLRATEDWAFRRYGHGPALGRGRETHKNRDLTAKFSASTRGAFSWRSWATHPACLLFGQLLPLRRDLSRISGAGSRIGWKT